MAVENYTRERPAVSQRPDDLQRKALVTLGEILGATARQSLPDVLAGWQRFCRIFWRDDLLEVACPLPVQPISIEASRAQFLKTWSYLGECVAQVAANLDALDSERHWQHAAGVMVQAASNAAEVNGLTVAHRIQAFETVMAELDDREIDAGGLREELLSDFRVDLLASLAARAGHFGRIALGETSRG